MRTKSGRVGGGGGGGGSGKEEKVERCYARARETTGLQMASVITMGWSTRSVLIPRHWNPWSSTFGCTKRM